MKNKIALHFLTLVSLTVFLSGCVSTSTSIPPTSIFIPLPAILTPASISTLANLPIATPKQINACDIILTEKFTEINDLMLLPNTIRGRFDYPIVNKSEAFNSSVAVEQRFRFVVAGASSKYALVAIEHEREDYLNSSTYVSFFALEPNGVDISKRWSLLIAPDNLSDLISTICKSIPVPTLTDKDTKYPAITLRETSFIKIYRNGKEYEIFTSFAENSKLILPESSFELPDWGRYGIEDKNGENIWRENSGAQIEGYGDFDKDNELEFFITFSFCPNYCEDIFKIYKYDPAADKYFAVDEFQARSRSFKNILDIDMDGNPEIITQYRGFCYMCGTFSQHLSAIEILRYENKKFVDVTKEFPKLIEKDADYFLELAKINPDGAEITFASYLYNMYRLNQMDSARQVFDQVCKKERLPLDCTTYRVKIEEYINQYESK